MSTDSSTNGLSPQAELESFRTDTKQVSLNRTVVCRCEVSDRKRARLRRAIDDWQRVADYAADMARSLNPWQWSGRDSALNRLLADEFDDLDIYAADRNGAGDKVREAYDSWNENGQDGEPPVGQFGRASHIRMGSGSASDYRRDIVPNDRGFGLRLSLLKPENDDLWFHLHTGEHQRKYLERVVDDDDDASIGTIEMHLDEDTGAVYAHIVVSETVEVFKAGDVSRAVGVDLGENVIYAAAVVDTDTGEVLEVDMESGAEFRHHRERLDRKRDQAAKQGKLRLLKQMKGDRERYTEQITNVCSRRIAELAGRYAPCRIRCENLTDYRETAANAIHDWPHAMLREQLAYKSTEVRIPFDEVDPAYTSRTCRQCGTTDAASRPSNDYETFDCVNCDYKVHADVNAAINIARGGVDHE